VGIASAKVSTNCTKLEITMNTANPAPFPFAKHCQSEDVSTINNLNFCEKEAPIVSSHKVTIIIPAFNEQNAIGKVLADLRSKLPEVEIIVVDDGSTDGTVDVLQSFDIRLLRHDRNLGYGASLRTGVLASQSEYVLFCDSDGQHTAEDVARIIEACVNCEMVVGTRGKGFYTSIQRAPGKLILRKFANYLAGQEIPDLNSGLRMIKRDVLLRYLHLMPEGFSFSTTSTFALLKGRYRVKWIPITVASREAASTSTVRQMKHGPQTLMLILRLTVLFEPLKVFLHVSAALLLMTIGFFAYDMKETNFHHLSGTTFFLGISTLLVFMFGLLCDQVSALRREFHDR